MITKKYSKTRSLIFAAAVLFALIIMSQSALSQLLPHTVSGRVTANDSNGVPEETKVFINNYGCF